MKCTIHSQHGSVMVIPREDNMVRLYIQLETLKAPCSDQRNMITQQQVQEMAKKIIHPYSIEWERVEWYSVYPISQGISDRYSLDLRVFLGGDACHTHSVSQVQLDSICNPTTLAYALLTNPTHHPLPLFPFPSLFYSGGEAREESRVGSVGGLYQPKAGQGMNMAFLDALNLAWKIHAVEGGLAHRKLLETYESERRSAAERLLNFDNRYAKLFSQRQPAAYVVEAVSSNGSNNHCNEKDDEFVKTFKESCELTSGHGVSYQPNNLNWSPGHPATSSLMHPEGTTLRTGHMFLSSNVTRVVDAHRVHLEQEVPLNGSFRIFIFAGNPSVTKIALRDLEHGLSRKGSFYSSYIRPDVDTVSHHEQHNPHSLFFTICTIFAVKRSEIEISNELPGLLARYRHHVYADDRWDFRLPDAKASAHAKMGFDQTRGAVAVVRPDGYVGAAIALVEGNGTIDALNEYFSAFCTKKLANTGSSL